MIEASTQNEQTALKFFEAWSRSDPAELMQYFDPDATYHNMPLSPLVGAAAVKEFLSEFFGAFRLRIETTALASSGPFVFSERIDYLRGTAGLCELRIVGVMEFDNGLITAWREYYDSRQAEGFSVEDAPQAQH